MVNPDESDTRDNESVTGNKDGNVITAPADDAMDDQTSGDKSANKIEVINKIPRTPPKSGHSSRKSTNNTVSNKYRSDGRSKSVGRNRSASTSNSKRKREGNEPLCGVCKQEFITGKQDCVECDLCFRWFHGPTCVNLSKKEIDAIALLGNKVCWYCNDCSVGASTLHKQTKLLNEAINTLDNEVSLLKSQQSANTQNLATANQNIAANKSDIKNNSTRITSAKNDITNISVNQQANTVKITALGTKIDALANKMQTEIQNQVNQKVNDDVIATTIERKIVNNTDTIEKNLMTKLKEHIKLTVDDKFKTLKAPENPAPIDTDSIKKAVDERFNAEFPALGNSSITSNNNDGNTTNLFPTRFTKAVQEEIAEREEIVRRKNQILVMNLKESKSETEDRNKLQDLFSLLKLNQEVRIKEAIRLGEKRRDGKHRFLRVTLEDLSMKRDILAKATSLRNVPEGHDLHKVYIKPNLTVKQNEASKNLQEDLRVRRLQDPTKKLKISKGKIVEVSPNN